MNAEFREPNPDEPVYAMTGPGAVFLRKYIWWIGGIMGLTFVTVMRFMLIHRPDPPPVILELPRFELTDSDGARFGTSDMEGKIWVVGFIFTRCRTLCPPISSAMVKMQEHILRSQVGDRVHFLTITVDPEYDTPERLREYADAIGADTRNWVFLTGSVEDVEQFVVRGFKLAVGERLETDPGVFDIAHSSRLALIDKHGGLRGLYSIDDESLEELYQTAIVLIRVP